MPARLEDVVRAAQDPDVAVRSDLADVSGAVATAADRPSGALLVAVVAGHQADRRAAEVHAEHRVLQHDVPAGQRQSEPPRPGPHPRGGADQRGGLGLSVALADGDLPGGRHRVGDPGREGLPGAGGLAQRWPGAAQVLDQLGPVGRRGAEAGHLTLRQQRRQQRGGGALLRRHHQGGLRGERHEETGPGVLRPAGRGDVQVPVARQQPVEVHRGQVADGVRRMGVQNEFGRRGGARGEVGEGRIGGPGRAGGQERLGGRPRLPVVVPAGHRRADRDPGGQFGFLEQGGGVAAGDQVPHPAATDPVGGLGAGQRGVGGDDHGAELEAGQDRLPELDLLAEHHHHPVAATDPQPGQPVGQPVGAERELLVGDREQRAVGLDQFQRGLRVAGRDHVEPLQRPVERLRSRPAEGLPRPRQVVAQLQQQVALAGELGVGRGEAEPAPGVESVGHRCPPSSAGSGRLWAIWVRASAAMASASEVNCVHGPGRVEPTCMNQRWPSVGMPRT